MTLEITLTPEYEDRLYYCKEQDRFAANKTMNEYAEALLKEQLRKMCPKRPQEDDF